MASATMVVDPRIFLLNPRIVLYWDLPDPVPDKVGVRDMLARIPSHERDEARERITKWLAWIQMVDGGMTEHWEPK